MRKLIVLTGAVLLISPGDGRRRHACRAPSDAITVEDAAAVTFGGTLQEPAITNVPMHPR